MLFFYQHRATGQSRGGWPVALFFDRKPALAATTVRRGWTKMIGVIGEKLSVNAAMMLWDGRSRFHLHRPPNQTCQQYKGQNYQKH